MYHDKIKLKSEELKITKTKQLNKDTNENVQPHGPVVKASFLL